MRLMMSVHFDAITLPELSAWERALETASPPETTQFSLVGTASAQINEGALLAFDSALPKQMIDDISNSLLFAQLAADKQFNRHTATGDWQRTFFGTLSVMGWITGSLSERTEVAASPVDWAELITSYMPENVDQLVLSSIAASQQLPTTSSAIRIWSNAALVGDEGVVIVGPSYISGDNPNMAIALLKFTFEKEVAGFLRWDVNFNITTSIVTMELNESIYSKVRNAVIAKLGNRPKYLIASVPMK
ncbi:hypothetical protein CN148_25635 [Sinorhizobium meliloti]|nr:hypothetical protein HB772_22875 [Sinorhizobium meliloti]RVL31806.1 hypothetical protein CN148_25635 [Sinorhizobium meliloti]RVL87546.1 hypothetical protein CN131_25300 [Sinorhizobium meliloti]